MGNKQKTMMNSDNEGSIEGQLRLEDEVIRSPSQDAYPLPSSQIFDPNNSHLSNGAKERADASAKLASEFFSAQRGGHEDEQGYDYVKEDVQNNGKDVDSSNITGTDDGPNLTNAANMNVDSMAKSFEEFGGDDHDSNNKKYTPGAEVLSSGDESSSVELIDALGVITFDTEDEMDDEPDPWLELESIKEESDHDDENSDYNDDEDLSIENTTVHTRNSGVIEEQRPNTRSLHDYPDEGNAERKSSLENDADIELDELLGTAQTASIVDSFGDDEAELEPEQTPGMQEVVSLIGSLEQQVKDLKTQVEDLESGKSRSVNILGKDDEKVFRLDRDLFTLLMRSKVLSLTWAFGVPVYICQVGLISLLFLYNEVIYFFLDGDKEGTIDGYTADSKTPWGLPLSVETHVHVAQCFAILLSLLVRQDIISSVLVLCMDQDFANQDITTSGVLFCTDCNRNKSKWHFAIGESNNDKTIDISSRSCGLRFRRFLLPNLMKLLKGSAALVSSMIIILKSTDVSTLIKDLIVIVILSSIDQLFFLLAELGHVTTELQETAIQCQKVKITETYVFKCFSYKPGVEKKNEGVALRAVILLVLFAAMITPWAFVVRDQMNGTFLHNEFPSCSIVMYSIARLGNGICDESLNIVECGFDAGDCHKVNHDEYKNCNATKLDPMSLGNGVCDEMFNHRDCKYDAFDCLNKRSEGEIEYLEVPDYPGCLVQFPELAMALGDGTCNEVNNSTECQFDGGDCADFPKNFVPGHPGCFAIAEWIGDGLCNPAFNTSFCDFDGGDCLYGS